VKRYRLARPAKADLDDIWLRVAQNASIEAADRFIDLLAESFPKLAAMPEMGRARDEIETGLRSFQSKSISSIIVAGRAAES
jgi:plasmid stabilization system protein ParE